MLGRLEIYALAIELVSERVKAALAPVDLVAQIGQVLSRGVLLAGHFLSKAGNFGLELGLFLELVLHLGQAGRLLRLIRLHPGQAGVRYSSLLIHFRPQVSLCLGNALLSLAARDGQRRADFVIELVDALRESSPVGRQVTQTGLG